MSGFLGTVSHQIKHAGDYRYRAGDHYFLNEKGYKNYESWTPEKYFKHEMLFAFAIAGNDLYKQFLGIVALRLSSVIFGHRPERCVSFDIVQLQKCLQRI